MPPTQQQQQQPKPNQQTPPPSSLQAMMTMQKQSKIAPVQKPQGLNPIDILNERENRYLVKIEFRLTKYTLLCLLTLKMLDKNLINN